MLYFGLGDARPYLKRKSDNLNKVLRPREEYLKSIFCCKISRRGLNRIIIINAKAHKKFIVHVTWAR